MTLLIFWIILVVVISFLFWKRAIWHFILFKNSADRVDKEYLAAKDKQYLTHKSMQAIQERYIPMQWRQDYTKVCLPNDELLKQIDISYNGETAERPVLWDDMDPNTSVGPSLCREVKY